jgi:hypothetical protein
MSDEPFFIMGASETEGMGYSSNLLFLVSGSPAPSSVSFSLSDINTPHKVTTHYNCGEPWGLAEESTQGQNILIIQRGGDSCEISL